MCESLGAQSSHLAYVRINIRKIVDYGLFSIEEWSGARGRQFARNAEQGQEERKEKGARSEWLRTTGTASAAR